ncbi:FtsQ-type POTRA domain-containing protein [Microbacterium sp. P05]|uniref:FtsQ-type POTRA domain-containing protein n=1 Tax=Microbacterium sp. P05 TaxID=3366948 RepID=UPI0037468289
MRRPSPLPAPAKPRPPAPVPEIAPDAVSGTPVLPFVAPSDRLPATSDRELGMRDVWRASRARRRALRAEVRRFTVRQRRRRMLWLTVLIAFVVLVAGTVGAAYSPLFAVQRIEVVGTSQLDAAAVSDALSDQLGTPLPLVDESAVKAALVQFPLVESYTLEARPPNDLVVRIVERQPVGLIESGAGFTVVDAAGVALATTPDAPAGLPLFTVQGGARSDAFRAAGQVVRSLPEEVRSQVTAVTASTPDDVAFTFGSTNAQVIWGSAERSADKALRLQAMMVGSPPDRVSRYDVSSPDAVIVG